jgi:hypothetical protein
MSRVWICAGLVAASLVAGVTAYGHHASAGLYEPDGSATVLGSVESLQWRNPHVRFSLLVMNAQGTEETWEIEGGSVNTLERIGVDRDLLAPGNVVEVSGSPGRNGRTIMFARSIVSSDGQASALNVAASERYAIENSGRSPADDLFRVWVPFRLPNTGAGRSEFPLTEAGRAARARWDPASDPALRCIPPGMPTAMDNPYPIEFEDRGDTIILQLEEWDGLRRIHMNAADADGSADPSSQEPSPMGYSVGRWEGDSLIVETSRISYPYLDDLGTPQSNASRITERFDLDRDAGLLSWTAQIVDPANLTEPLEFEIAWEFIPGNVIKPYNCALPGND